MTQRKCEDPEHAGEDIYTKVYYDATGKLRDVFRPYYASDSYDYGYDVGAALAKKTRLFYTLEPAESARLDTICPDYAQQPGLRKEMYYRNQDLACGVTRIRDLGGRWTETWVDKLGNKVKVRSDSDDGETYQNEAVFTYNTVGDLLTVTDAEGKTFASEYDRMSRRTSYGSPDMYAPGSPAQWDISWEYDGASNIDTYVDPNLMAAGLQLKYEYDELNRVKRNYVTDGSVDIHYDYDHYEGMGIDWDAIVDIDGQPIPRAMADNAKGRLTCTSSTGDDRIEIRFYSKRGEILQRSVWLDDREYHTRYEYDEAGQLMAMTLDPAQPPSLENKIVYTRDERGLVTDIDAHNGLATASFTYLPDDRVETIARGSSMSTSYGYDRLGRLQELCTTPLNFTRFVYRDGMGDITQVREGPTGPIIGTYQYDDLHRLDYAQVTASSGFPSPPSITQDYEYDKVGNLRTMLGSPGDYQYVTGTNRLSSIQSPQHSCTFDYDYNGNVVLRDVTHTLTGILPTVFHMEYDYMNRMIFVQADGHTGEGYVYGPDARRVMRRTTDSEFEGCGGRITDYVYEGNDIVYEAYTYDKLRNGGFEAHTQTSDPVHFAGWMESTGNDPENIQADLGEDGDCVKISYTADGDPTWGEAPDITQVKIPVEPNATCTLQVVYRTNTDQCAYVALGRWDTGNHNDIALPGTGGTWQTALVVWTSSTGEYHCTAFLGVNKDVSGTVWFDNATMHPGNIGTSWPAKNAYLCLNGNPIARLSRTVGGSEYSVNYVYADHSGNICLITDAQGQEIGRCEYQPFGAELGRLNMEDYRYRFSGEEQEQLTGIYYYGARFHDQVAGRWLTLDPVPSNHTSPYSFVYDNPLVYSDPNGEFPWLVAALAAAGATYGGYQAHQHGQNWFLGALAGAGLGALGGVGITAYGFGSLGMSIAGGAIGTEIGIGNQASVGDLWKYTLAGATFGFTLGYGLTACAGGYTFTENLVFSAGKWATASSIESIYEDRSVAQTIGDYLSSAVLKGGLYGVAGFGLAKVSLGFSRIWNPKNVLFAHMAGALGSRIFEDISKGEPHHGLLGWVLTFTGEMGDLGFFLSVQGAELLLDDYFEHVVSLPWLTKEWSPQMYLWEEVWKKHNIWPAYYWK